MKSYSSRIGRSVYTFRSAILTCVALAAGGGFGCGSSVPPENAELHSRVRSLLRPFRGSVGIYAEDLSGSKQYAYQADDLFPTASVFKVAVMIELFQRAERIELLLDDRRPIAKGISHHGTGKLKEGVDQPDSTLLEYCRLMIAESDNVATDTLMKMLPPAAVTATLRELGFPKTHVAGNCTEMHYQMAGIDSRVGSPKLDQILLDRARAGSLVEAGFADSSIASNVTTPREMAAIFRRIYDKEIISHSASVQMLELLKQTSSRSLIPKHLSPDTVVAHKVGGTWRVKADVGIVYLERGPLLISLFSYYHRRETQAADILAEISRLIVEWVERS